MWIDNGDGPKLWMWDLPNEVDEQKELATQASGDVLVAGYGLGLVQKFLSENSRVSSITTIEILPEVVEECKRVFGQIYGQIIVGDFYEYQTDKLFDCVVGDIWIDKARRHLDEYKKFKRKASSLLKPEGKIFGWGSDYFEFLIQAGNSN